MLNKILISIAIATMLIIWNKIKFRDDKLIFRFSLLLLAFLVIHACRFNFSLTEDTLIFFRYAENFIKGHGLVYNVGEKVEGYTSLLWTLILSMSYLLSIPIELWVVILGTFFSFSLLIACYLFFNEQISSVSLFKFLPSLLLVSSIPYIYTSFCGLDEIMFVFFIFILLVFSIYLFKTPSKNSLADDFDWATVGSAGFSDGSAFYTSLAIDGNNIPYIAYQDEGKDNKVTVMKYSTTTESWDIVGILGFSAGTSTDISLAIDSNNTPYVAYRDGGTSNAATVMKYSTTTYVWINVGTPGFSAGEASYTSLAIDSNNVPYVAYRDSAEGNKATRP